MTRRHLTRLSAAVATAHLVGCGDTSLQFAFVHNLALGLLAEL